MLFDHTSSRKESQQATYRFAYDWNAREASVPATRDHEHFARTFCLLHSQPPFGAFYGVRCVGHRRTKVQRSGSTEAKLVESVLERTADHASLADGRLQHVPIELL